MQQLIVERAGSEVRIIRRCSTIYEAIKLYDELDQQSGEGRISIVFGVRNNDDTSSR